MTQSSALEAYSALLSISVAVMLLAFLIARELLLASGSARARKLAHALTIASIPLLIGFLFIAGLRLSALAQPAAAPATPRATSGASAGATPTARVVPSASPTMTATPHDLVVETFDLRATGSRPTGWTRQPRTGIVSVAAFPSRLNRSLRVDGVHTSSGATSCLGFPVSSSGALAVDLDILLDRLPGASAGSIVIAQGQAQRSALSLLPGGRLGYVNGARMSVSETRLTARRWYRTTLTVDLDNRQYAYKIQDRELGTPATVRTGLGWRTTNGTGVDRICVTSPPEAVILYVDNVRISR